LRTGYFWRLVRSFWRTIAVALVYLILSALLAGISVVCPADAHVRCADGHSQGLRLTGSTGQAALRRCLSRKSSVCLSCHNTVSHASQGSCVHCIVFTRALVRLARPRTYHTIRAEDL
jgi:hypothetical protein